MRLEVATDDQTLYTNPIDGSINVRVSQKANNGVSIGDDGKLHLQLGPSGDGKVPEAGENNTISLPGNVIDGKYGKGLSIIRCNKYVTRISRAEGDINAPLASDIVNGILNGR